MTGFAIVVLILLLAKGVTELWLARLNCRHVLAHAQAVPDALRTIVDPKTYAQAVDYTLAKARLGQIITGYDAVVLGWILFGGILPWTYTRFTYLCGESVWAGAAFLVATGLVLSCFGLPFDWYAQFHLEDRFGFNTTTPRLWWTDRFKGWLLAVLLGYPLLALVLKLVQWSGQCWWLWAWGAVLGFQLILFVLAPVLILPWFNRFTPLPEGSLRHRLLALATRTGFRTRSVQVMDGSKRSRHSNAFFTGFGRFRKIVLFDTLVEQLTEAELAAVLAHELGHWRKKHIAKMLAASAAGMMLGFYLLSVLVQQDGFYRAFGFPPGRPAPALLLFGLLSGIATFWFSPLANFWSRRYEYQADAFAAATTGEIASLVGALRKLNAKNLSNLTPHPAYSFFHYSHPTLLERERALNALRF